MHPRNLIDVQLSRQAPRAAVRSSQLGDLARRLFPAGLEATTPGNSTSDRLGGASPVTRKSTASRGKNPRRYGKHTYGRKGAG